MAVAANALRHSLSLQNQSDPRHHVSPDPDITHAPFSAPGDASLSAHEYPWRPLLLGAGILAVAFNLRTALSATAPLMETIIEDTGLSSSATSMLTTLPVICFGLLAPFAPKLARRFGMDLTVWATMIVLAIGILIRIASSQVALFGGTILIGAAIAIANVILPGLLKRDFPHGSGLMTGLYTVGLTTGSSLAAGITIPLQHAAGLGWRGTLAIWAIPAVIAALILMPRLRTNRAGRPLRQQESPLIVLWREPIAWQVTLFMGLQSFAFFIVMTWLPTIFIDAGMAESRAGLMLSLTNLFGVVTGFAMPILAGRSRGQAHLVIITIALWVTGIGGLLVAPLSGTILWIACIGLAQGAVLGIALSMMVLRSPDASHAARLSGMAQSVGYCLAALGPFLGGYLHDLTGSWASTLVLPLALMAPLLLVGLGAARDRVLGQPGLAQAPA